MQLNWYKEIFICKLEEFSVVDNAYSFSVQKLFEQMKLDEHTLEQVAEAFGCAVGSLVEDSYKMVMEEVGKEVEEEDVEASAITTPSFNEQGDVEFSSVITIAEDVEFTIATTWTKEHGVADIWDALSVDVDNEFRKQHA